MLSESEQEQFTRLWTEAQPSVSHYILSLVRDFSAAQDILQATALVLLKKFPEYEEKRPFLPWALRFARFEVLSHRRDHARAKILFDSELLEKYTTQWAELAPAHTRDVSALQICLKTLPDRLSRLLHLRYFEELNSAEISKRIGLSPSNIRVTLQRAREQLRACVEQQIKLEEGLAK